MANPLAAGLDVAGQLSVIAGDVPIDVAFQGDAIVVTLPSLRAGTRLLRQLPPGDRRLWGDRLVATLDRAGLALQVRVQDRLVAGRVPGQKTGSIARWIGAGPLDLKYRAILASLFGRAAPPGESRP